MLGKPVTVMRPCVFAHWSPSKPGLTLLGRREIGGYISKRVDSSHGLEKDSSGSKSWQEGLHSCTLTHWVFSDWVQSFLTLYYPMDCSHPGSFVLGISHARILEWFAISFPKESSLHRDRTQVFHWKQILYQWVTREALAINHSRTLKLFKLFKFTPG